MNVTLKSIQLTSGPSIEVNDGITVIVGPNNAGKSALLGEVMSMLNRDPQQNDGVGKVVHSISVDWGDPTQALAQLKREFSFHQAGTATELAGTYGSVFVMPSGAQVSEHQAQAIIASQKTLGPFAPGYAHLFSPENRTEMLVGVPPYSLFTERPSLPMQVLYRDSVVAERLSEEAQTAFGQPVTFNPYGGSVWTLHVGSPAIPEVGSRPSDEYLAELMNLEQVAEQGHGFRAYIGIALTILAGTDRVLLLDEPEAFLHPPQARSLGRLLARLTQGGVRLLVATHSNDLLQGISEASRGGTSVAIHRITRDGKTNGVASIPNDSVRELYQDSFMRFSSVLDGLFFHGVVVCEAENDCTYYRAVLEEQETTARRVDIHFTHTNGKARLAHAVRALRAASVPVVSVADIDILGEGPELKSLVEAHGGSIAPLSGRLATLQQSVISKGSPASRREFLEVVEPIQSESSSLLEEAEIKSVRQAVRNKSGWKQFKKAGRALLTGDVLEAFESLITDLKVMGIFVVPVGELESFHPEKDFDDKQRWIREVLDEDLFKIPGAQDAFVRGLREHIASNQVQ